MLQGSTFICVHVEAGGIKQIFSESFNYILIFIEEKRNNAKSHKVTGKNILICFCFQLYPSKYTKSHKVTGKRTYTIFYH